MCGSACSAEQESKRGVQLQGNGSVIIRPRESKPTGEPICVSCFEAANYPRYILQNHDGIHGHLEKAGFLFKDGDQRFSPSGHTSWVYDLQEENGVCTVGGERIVQVYHYLDVRYSLAARQTSCQFWAAHRNTRRSGGWGNPSSHLPKWGPTLLACRCSQSGITAPNTKWREYRYQ